MELDIKGLEKLVNDWFKQQPEIPAGTKLIVQVTCTPEEKEVSIETFPEEMLLCQILTLEKLMEKGYRELNAKMVIIIIKAMLAKNTKQWEQTTVREFLETVGTTDIPRINTKGRQALGEILQEAGFTDLPEIFKRPED